MRVADRRGRGGSGGSRAVVYIWARTSARTAADDTELWHCTRSSPEVRILAGSRVRLPRQCPTPRASSSGLPSWCRSTRRIRMATRRRWCGAWRRSCARWGRRRSPRSAVGRHAYVYARFGAGVPRLLLNAHVDTVPANAGYTSPPHELVRRGNRLHGLGSADTKGAIAAILEALAAGPVTRPVGVLFSGDEEHGGSCIRAFLDTEAARGLTQAIVCEPTQCRVGARHRGIGAATATLRGGGRALVARRQHGQPDRRAGARRRRPGRAWAWRCGRRGRPDSRAWR